MTTFYVDGFLACDAVSGCDFSSVIEEPEVFDRKMSISLLAHP